MADTRIQGFNKFKPNTVKAYNLEYNLEVRGYYVFLHNLKI